MRLLIIAAGLLLLGGCTASARKTLGQYQAIADKGITIGNPGPPTDEVAGSSGPAEPAKPNLPGTLGGDHEHHIYSNGPK